MHCTRRPSSSLPFPVGKFLNTGEAPSIGTEHLRRHSEPTNPTLALPLALLTGCFAPLHPRPGCDGKLHGKLHPAGRRGPGSLQMRRKQEFLGLKSFLTITSFSQTFCLTASPIAVLSVALFPFHLSNPTCFQGILTDSTDQTCTKQPDLFNSSLVAGLQQADVLQGGK